MTLSEFTFSKRFLGEFDVPCLSPTVKNSELPCVAFRHISEFEEDPDCTIYLRGQDSEKISAWEQEILDRLFKNEGLAAAVNEDMKEYRPVLNGVAKIMPNCPKKIVSGSVNMEWLRILPCLQSWLMGSNEK
jgi:hypothetical protein